MTKWHGTVVHLHVEKLQPRGHVHWRYRVAAAMSQSREFRPKNRIFSSQIISESSKRMENDQHRSKRIVN